MGSMPRRLVAGAMLFAVAASGWATGETYCCQDAESGRRVCSDVLPVQCKRVGYQIRDAAGNVIQEVGPPMTSEQRAAQKALELKKKREDELAREQRRRDQALLDTYATPEDIDLAQKKAEDDVKFAMRATQARIDAESVKLRKLEAEAEFYKKKEMPGDLRRQLDAVRDEIRLQQELLDLKSREFVTIKAKYDGDRRRYAELTGLSTPVNRNIGGLRPR